MKRKLDFTVKGTKLPVIPKGTEYNIEHDEYGYAPIYCEIENMVSFGIASNSEIFAESPGYTGKQKYIFHLSTIEALAEKQGMLWVEDENHKLQPSIKQLLDKASNLEYNYRTGFDLFYKLDESYRKEMCERALLDLRETVAQLNIILNPVPMQSVVEIAESSDKL